MTTKAILSMLCLAISIASLSTMAFTYVRSPHSSILSKVNHHSDPAKKSDDYLLDAEEAAARDAHDLSDAGMEAAAMERAVMIAEEFRNDRRKMELHSPTQTAVQKKKTFVQESTSIDFEDSDFLLEAEEAAARDAHVLSDAGMEAAAMERAVVIADEMKREYSKKNQ